MLPLPNPMITMICITKMLEMKYSYNHISRLTVVSRAAKESRINARAIIKTRLYIHHCQEVANSSN